jgi:predicted translation initiation factor SUI1
MDNDKIVYSYTLGDKPEKFNANAGKDGGKYNAPDDGFVRIRLEKNQRGGKTVTVIYGFDGKTNIAELCSELKKKCGSGGTVKDNRIEIQGDKRDAVEKYLSTEGFKTKRAGG